MSKIYKLNESAEAFGKFCEQQNGEKALLWSQLRLRVFEQITDNFRPDCLDYGCGTGWLANRLAEEFRVFAYGYDPEPAMIAQTKKGSAREFFTSRFDEIKQDGPYNLVFCVFLFPAMDYEESIHITFRRIKETLSPGGRVCVAGINPDTTKTVHQFFTSHFQRGMLSGSPYKTEILIKGESEPLTLTDYYWPAKTIATAGATAGLRLIRDSFVGDGLSSIESLNFPYRIWDFVKV